MFYDLQKTKLTRCFNRYIKVFAEAMSLTISTPTPVSPSRVGLDLPLTALVDVAEERERFSPTHRRNKTTKSKSLSDYAQQDLSVVTRRPQILDMEMLQVKKWTQAY
jgi:hypothetical protein